MVQKVFIKIKEHLEAGCLQDKKDYQNVSYNSGVLDKVYSEVGYIRNRKTS